ncbi:MAG: Gfo/Idh/MocA family oxidoreductase [Puniceicoccales bacterium]|jgi:predicted dehydrogenase|nr:Gfo/Idh/MocA family oxidoreductase [Puniceicoccales bacterium]
MLTIKRREFLATSTLATAGILTLGGRALLAQETAAAAPTPPPAPKLKLAIVGCGQRGVWLGGLALRHGGYEIHAVADYFPDRAKKAASRLKVPAERTFSGLSGFKRLLETKPDAIAIEVSPWFHSPMAVEAVNAGIHVFLAKPIAVDVPGTLAIEAAAKLATEKKQCFLVDFQTRTNPFYQEAIRRASTGAMGDIIFGEGIYHENGPHLGVHAMSKPEDRMRYWCNDYALSGDIILENNIHTLDVMSWSFGDKPPLQAFGTRGRKWRRHDSGDTNDHYTLHYQYPGGASVTFSSRQFQGHGTTPDGIGFRLFGTKGVMETKYSGTVLIRGDKEVFYRGGKTSNIYEEGVVVNLAAFHRAITTGDFSNPTVAPAVRSNLVGLLGRMAAQTGRVVTWDEVLRDTNRLDGRLEGLRD